MKIIKAPFLQIVVPKEGRAIQGVKLFEVHHPCLLEPYIATQITYHKEYGMVHCWNYPDDTDGILIDVQRTELTFTPKYSI